MTGLQIRRGDKPRPRWRPTVRLKHQLVFPRAVQTAHSEVPPHRVSQDGVSHDSGTSASSANELELRRLLMEYEGAMCDIDGLVEANQGEFPRGRAISELFEKSFAIADRITELRRKQKTR